VHRCSQGTYGSPRVHAELGRRGVRCGRDRVARLMKLHGLEGRCKRRWRRTIVRGADEQRELDLIQRHFGPSAVVDPRYVGDTTYVWTWQGFAYLATGIDLASGAVVGWAVADHMRTKLVTDALHMAFQRRRPASGVIIHSDRGSQGTSQPGLCRPGQGQRSRPFL
jgi:putative transposase